MADCNDYPTPEDSKLFKQDAGTLNEVITSENALTSPASDGKQKNTLRGLEAKYLMTPLNGGIWATGIEFKAYNQYMIYNGVSYKPKRATVLPYTSEATPNVANVEPFSDVTSDSLGGLTNYQAASVQDMIAGITVGGGDIIAPSIPQYWSSAGNLWRRIGLGSTISDFENVTYQTMIQGIDDARIGGKVLKYPEGEFSLDSLVQLIKSEDFRGEGKEITKILTRDGIKAEETTTGRNSVKNITIENPDGPSDRKGTGFSASKSSFAEINDAAFNFFDIGIEGNASSVGVDFSARNTYTNFETNACNTGIKSVGENISNYAFGRTWFNDVGIELDNTEAVNFIGVNVENNSLGLRARNGAHFNIYGGYFEAGSGNQNFDIQGDCRVNAQGLWVNGERGWVNSIDPNLSEFHWDVRDTAASYARFTMYSSASKQYVKNPDFSRSTTSWSGSAGGAISIVTSGVESGGGALRIQGNAEGSNANTSFNIEQDVKVMAIAVRYKALVAGQQMRVNVTNNGVTIAQATESRNDDTTSIWRTQLIRAVINDPSQPVFINILPDVSGGNNELIVDQVWAVRGYFVSAPRAYGHDVELLESQINLVTKNNVTSNQADDLTGALPYIPTNAIGMRLRVNINGALAGSNVTEYTVGNAKCQAFVNGRNHTSEITVVGVAGVSGGLSIGTSGNSTSYTVDLIEWILEQ